MSENANPHANLNWLLEELVTGVVGARHAIVLSTDGMLIERSNGLPKDEADQLAAMASALQSLARGVGERFEGGLVRQNIVEMAHGFLFVTAAGEGACLALLAEETADMGMIGYEMNRLVKRVRQHLSAAPRHTPVGAADGGLRA
ncbi:MAG TPA: roadblock/LC7 domain-containing protein [Pseudonocardiaceae bacterium]|jgi:predicted regulator of Ras-like GTPase activity (Roadblock/LC7/MglB family)|nr:roadblock/LC7 domain-containing protein [Pseudonocardiaceae bacterium]